MTTPSHGKAGGYAWSTATNAPAQLALARATATLIQLFPYFDQDAYTLQPVFVEGFNTIGVTKDKVLILDPACITRWSRKALAFGLAHELMHGFVNTHGRFPEGGDHALWNQASDAEINDDLCADPRAEWPWPPVTPQSLGLTPHQTAETYYAELLARPKSPKCQCQCATGKGDPGQRALEGELDRIFGRSDEEKTADRLALAEAMNEAESKKPGTVPLNAMRVAQNLRRPAVVRWEDQFRRILRGRINSRPGSRIATYRTPNRRQGAVGFGVGKPVMSSARDTTPTIWVAIDTSGSMSAQALAAGLAEFRHVLKAARARVTFLSCDAEVHNEVQVTESTDLTKLCIGGGGTDFRPIFTRALDARRHHLKTAPDLLVVFTDGMGVAPEADPGLNTIWLLSGTSAVKPAPWGHSVMVPV